jgi:hypothetical protein
MATEVSQITQTTSNIPDWAKGFAERLLGESEKLSRRGYQAYPGQITSEFNPLQEQAFMDIAGMRVAPQVGQATGLAGLAGLRAQEASQYDPMQSRQFYRSPLQQPGGLNRYMSPYMQGVVEQQKSQAIRDYGRQLPGMAAAAARVGAKGGTREALVRSEGQRNLFDQLGNIQATGLQNAFQQAQAQAAQDAALRAQYGLAGANLAEQSRQFGAGLGLQGIGQQLAAAGTLGQLGQQQYGQKLGIGQAQLGAGAQIQSLAQQDLTNRYQQFLDQQRLPFQQLSWFSDILRGTPASGATQTLYQQPPNVLGQVAGLGLGLGSLFGGSSS